MKKKSLKKVTSAVLVAAMSMGLLAGCGGSKSSEEAKTDVDGATVIKFGIHVANPKKQETVTYNIVQGFNKENKGKYKVEFVAADTEAHSKNMKLAAQDGSLPEIVHLDSAEAPEYNEAGYLLDMSDFLKENKDIWEEKSAPVFIWWEILTMIPENFSIQFQGKLTGDLIIMHHSHSWHRMAEGFW